jgi:hypothetical protein
MKSGRSRQSNAPELKANRRVWALSSGNSQITVCTDKRYSELSVDERGRKSDLELRQLLLFHQTEARNTAHEQRRKPGNTPVLTHQTLGKQNIPDRCPQRMI